MRFRYEVKRLLCLAAFGAVVFYCSHTLLLYSPLNWRGPTIPNSMRFDTAVVEQSARNPAVKAPSLAILVVVKSGDLLRTEYELASSTLGCYVAAKSRGYPLYYVDYGAALGGERTAQTEMGSYTKLSDEWYALMKKKCMEGVDERRERDKSVYDGKFMWIRHCAVAEFMTAQPDRDWVLVLDSDVGVVNPEHRVEEWLDDEADVIFYERDFNWEVMAGGYLLRNSDSARRFLNAWADTFSEFAKRTTSYHLNFDNGSLNRLLLQLFATPAENKKCDEFYWSAGRDQDIVLHAICCRYFLERHAVKTSSGGAVHLRNETFGLVVKLLPRGTAWMRDAVRDTVFGKWSPERDFMMHGWKKRFLDFDPKLYGTAWTSPFKENESPDLAKCGSDAQNEALQLQWQAHWKSDWIISGAERDAIFGEHTKNLTKQRDEFITAKNLSAY